MRADIPVLLEEGVFVHAQPTRASSIIHLYDSLCKEF